MLILYKMYSVGGKIEERRGREGINSTESSGFQKRDGNIDYIYVLNFLINRQLRKKRRNY